MADDILQDALDNYEVAVNGWTNIFEKGREDLEFQSDEDDAQWIDSRLRKSRKFRYTIDQLGQFIHQVENDVRMNTPTIQVIPDGNGSDKKTAEIFQGLIKGIEYKSNADAAYDTAVSFAIRSSIGFLRVDHKYIDEESFEQELCIERVVNPFSIYIDPASIQPDGSDAMFGFVLEEISIKEFNRLYPNKSASSFGSKVELREADKSIVIAEYFKIVEESKEVGMDKDGRAVPYTNQEKKRTIKTRKVMRYKLSGSEVLEETTFPGRYIPLVPVYGEEAWIDGKRNLYSLIRKSKSSQMMYNLTKTLEVEVLMKQPQAPFIAPAGATSGFEQEYKDPSLVNVLHYNPTDINGNPITAPQRSQPPTLPTGFAALARESIDDIKATMGLYNASIGQRSNEQSGVAINARKLEGDVATFHFGDNLVRSITQVGRILVFAIPEIYDTARIIKIIGEEDESKTVGINGEREQDQEETYDLAKGKYDVRVITGAAFTTQRQEAAALYNQLIQSMPDLMPIIGDLVFKYQDTAGSQAIAARMKKLVDPKLLDEDDREDDQQMVDPEKEQMAQALQAMQAQMAELQAQLENKQADLQLKAQDQQLKAQSEATKAEIESAKLALEAKKLELEQQKIEIEAYNAQKEPVQQKEPQSYPAGIKLDTTGFQMMKTPEQEELERMEFEAKQAQEAQEMEMKMAQTNAVIEALNGIQQQVAELSQATVLNAEQTARVAQNQEKPVEVIRDEEGNIIGAK